MKPLEFKIEEKEDLENYYVMVFYYENGRQEEIDISFIPLGLELNKHYSIADMYGYKVVDDRRGL